MKILWMTWKDMDHPQSGGAELINEEIAFRLVRDGHDVCFIVGGYPGCEKEIERNGVKIVRLGGRYSVYWQAFRFYKKHLKGWADLVVDEMNTIPFFCKYYVKEKNLLFAYQLCREIWFYQMRFPLSVVGFLLEIVFLRLLRNQNVITISESTKKDMIRFGFRADRISIVPIGISIEPLKQLKDVEKFSRPTLLSLGSIRKMKQTCDQIEAFEISKKAVPKLQLKIAGVPGDAYGEKVLHRIKKSEFKSDIEYLGRVDEAQKTELMQKSHLILVTSVKEGWGLIVTEANSQGTPAVVYDVDGLRDSVKNKETGWISKNNSPNGLADCVIQSLQNIEEYEKVRNDAWLWSKDLTLEKCYLEFKKSAGIS